MLLPLANSYPKKCSAIADAIATPLFAFGSIVEVLDSIVDTLVNGPVNDGSIMVMMDKGDELFCRKHDSRRR